MEFPVELTIALDRRKPHVPGPVRKHHHVRAEFGSRLDRLLTRGYGIDPVGEIIFRPRPDLDPRLLIVFSVAFDKAGAQRIDDHWRGFVKALAGLVHGSAKRCKFAPRQASA